MSEVLACLGGDIVIGCSQGEADEDFGDLLSPDPVRLAKRLEAEGFGIRAAIPRLAW